MRTNKTSPEDADGEVQKAAATETRSLNFPELPVFTGGGLQPGVDLDRNALLFALLDNGTTLVRSR
ncbi:MAG: hypothetical protein HQ453_07355 [Actinobacteria bacterium]|nr:hypothetical protein [Actinomycetota bacterium]